MVELRRQLAGAINNAAQLQAVAEDVYPDVVPLIEERGVFLTQLIGRCNALGRPS